MGRLWQGLRARRAAPRARPAAAWGQLAPSSICWRRAALSTSSLLWLQPRLRLEQGYRGLAQHPSISPFPPCSSVGSEQTWLSPRGTPVSPAQSPNPTEHHPGPSIPARPLRGDSHSPSQRPGDTDVSILPEELPAPLPQPCQQPGSSLESSALPAARRKLLFAREERLAGPAGLQAVPSRGAVLGNKPRLILRAGTRCVLRRKSRIGAGMCLGTPFWVPYGLGASSEPLCPNSPSSRSLRSRSQRRGEKSQHQPQREQGR